MIQLNNLAQFLNRFFTIDRFENDQGGIYRASERLVQRLGLALEPWPDIATWVEREQLDALWLHRPWRLPPNALGYDIGVVAHHLAFDERLTLGYNERLAPSLELTKIAPLGEKAGRPLGMFGSIPPHSFVDYRQAVHEIFGGLEEARPSTSNVVTQVAVVGAMTDALVREAAERGVDVYITGQWRKSAAAAVNATGIGVMVVGHRRSEEWGLRALAHVLSERWSYLDLTLA